MQGAGDVQIPGPGVENTRDGLGMKTDPCQKHSYDFFRCLVQAMNSVPTKDQTL